MRAGGKCEPIRGHVLKDESGQPDKDGDMGIPGGRNKRHTRIRAAEMMKGKKLANRQGKEEEE